jgi:hypothetical protein
MTVARLTFNWASRVRLLTRGETRLKSKGRVPMIQKKSLWAEPDVCLRDAQRRLKYQQGGKAQALWRPAVAAEEVTNPRADADGGTEASV